MIGTQLHITWGFFSRFLKYYHHSFICHPLDSTVSKDARIEPSIVETFALASREDLTTLLNLTHTHSDLIHCRLDLFSCIGIKSARLNTLAESSLRLLKRLQIRALLTWFGWMLRSMVLLSSPGRRKVRERARLSMTPPTLAVPPCLPRDALSVPGSRDFRPIAQQNFFCNLQINSLAGDFAGKIAAGALIQTNTLYIFFEFSSFFRETP